MIVFVSRSGYGPVISPLNPSYTGDLGVDITAELCKVLTSRTGRPARAMLRLPIAHPGSDVGKRTSSSLIGGAAMIDAKKLPLFALIGGLVLLLSACAEERAPISESEIWDDPVEQTAAGYPVTLLDREQGNSYDLPRAGMNSIADLISVYDGRGNNENYFFSEEYFTSEERDAPLQECRFDGAVPRASLPMVIEGVVTHYPRRFLKVEVCDFAEDERFWGAFTIEDDTGGIVVLRPGRTATFGFGDRVRLTVYGLMLTFGRDPDTRAVLSYDLEVLSRDESPDLERPVLYERVDRRFGAEDATEVKQIEGVIFQSPNNANFNEMLVADRSIDMDFDAGPLSGSLLNCVRSCEGACNVDCDYGDACSAFCEEQCSADPNDVPTVGETPVCWPVSIDIDLGRRGFSPPEGALIRATGPIVNNFDRQLWVYSPDQVEIVEAP